MKSIIGEFQSDVRYVRAHDDTNMARSRDVCTSRRELSLRYVMNAPQYPDTSHS